MTILGRERQPSIDVLRAAAIALMVIVHFVENLSARFGDEVAGAGGVHRLWWLPTGFAAATFTLLSGISYRMWLDGQLRRGHSDPVITGNTLRRGAFLLVLGFGFNLVVWLPEGLFNWDVLTLIGCGLLTLEVARRMPTPVVVFTAGVIVALAPTMRILAGYREFWTTGSFEYDFTVSDIVLGWLATGYFPIFPWLAFPLLGFALASWQRSGDPRLARLGVGLAVVSGALALGWRWLPDVVTDGRARAWTMFPASTAYVFGSLGGVCLALAAAHRLLDGATPRRRGLVAWATPLSRHALSMYILHHVVHIWPLWAYGYTTTPETTSLWQRALPLGASLGLAAAFLVAAAVLCRLIDRWNLPTAESWMRRVCES